jgi:HTH-type transcriptional regulator/antitoxin HigA
MTTKDQEASMTAFVPAEVFSPGDIIQDELSARGWTQSDLATIMGRPLQAVNEIINAKKRVTEETAKQLEAALGIDADFWLRTEALYRLHHTDPESARARIARRAALRQRVPLRHLLTRGWIEPTDDEDELETRVKHFLGIKSLEERPAFAMAAKQTVYGEPLTTTQEAWLVRAKHLAKTVAAAPYSAEKLEGVIEQFTSLLRSPDDVHHVPRMLAGAGVKFVVVEQLPSLKTDALCFWIEQTEPVIAMSLVHDRIDNFWFGVRHECEHVLNGDGKDEPIVDNDFDKPNDSSEQERVANAAAAEFCVPQHLMDDFMNRKGPLYSDADIRGFAHANGRHAGLVAGQLRRRLGAWNKYTNHLARVRHIVVESATVDGFGHMPTLGGSSKSRKG